MNVVMDFCIPAAKMEGWKKNNNERIWCRLAPEFWAQNGNTYGSDISQYIGPKDLIALEFRFLWLNIENNVEDLVISNSFMHSVVRQTLVFSSFHTRWMDEKSAVQHLVC